MSSPRSAASPDSTCPGQHLQLLARQSECLAEVLDYALQPVCADCACQHRMLRTEALVNALYQRVPDAPGEVEVYVRQRSHFLGDEALEAEVPRERVDVADADEVSHEERDGRAASPARWPCLQRHFGTHQPALLHYLARYQRNLPVQQQEARHAVKLYQAELFAQSCLGPCVEISP